MQKCTSFLENGTDYVGMTTINRPMMYIIFAGLIFLLLFHLQELTFLCCLLCAAYSTSQLAPSEPLPTLSARVRYCSRVTANIHVLIAYICLK